MSQLVHPIGSGLESQITPQKVNILTIVTMRQSSLTLIGTVAMVHEGQGLTVY